MIRNYTNVPRSLPSGVVYSVAVAGQAVSHGRDRLDGAAYPKSENQRRGGEGARQVKVGREKRASSAVAWITCRIIIIVSSISYCGITDTLNSRQGLSLVIHVQLRISVFTVYLYIYIYIYIYIYVYKNILYKQICYQNTQLFMEYFVCCYY